MKSAEASFQEHFNRRNNSRDEYRCCFCFHVRTATICYGMWHVIMHILFFILLTMMIQHPVLLKSKNVGIDLVKTSQDLDLPLTEPRKSLTDITDSSSESNDYYTLYIRHRKWGIQDVKLALFITLCTFILSGMLLYGAIKGRPIYLMPFFCFQVLNLGISFVSLASYLSYMPDMKCVLAKHMFSPIKDEIMKMDSHWVNSIFLLVFVGSIIVQTYFMNMVWSCYKYLVTKEFRRSNISSFVISDAESQLPPDYDTATKLPEYYVDLQAPPPPYPAEESRTTQNQAPQQ